GLCTAWHRGQYVFDGCLRWLMGSQPPSVFHQIWTELGAITGRKVLIHEEMLRIEWPDGKAIQVPSDLDELGRLFKQTAPEDGPLIDQLVRDARRCASLEPPLEKPLELMNPLEKTRLGLRYFPIAPVVFRYKNVSIVAYAARYKNKLLREALQIIVGNEDMSALVLVMLLAFRTRKNTGFVAGGSWDFAMAIADRYRRLGGLLRLNSRVVSVVVSHGRATAVTCADGSSVPAATVVSCADGHTTLFKMLEGKFMSRKLRFLYDHCQTFPAILQVSLGIGKVFPSAPHTLNLPLKRPLRVDDRTSHERLEVESFDATSRLCPEGKTLMTVRLPTRYDFWAVLKKEDALRYRAEKRRIVEEVIAVLEQRFPGVKSGIERFDIATPATYFRYTGNWQGSYEGWLPTPRLLGRRIPYTLPRLKNFYMAGHWVVPGGGLPSAALAGRYVAQMICAQFGKKFVPRTP
ncbi:MAG TPA: FAD-dependent oxidoreductase, partial [Candidatus Acidoferrales bacterium]|nr:FAD-dependent oxidoreductase [Candidatus Acidoferrales bacterium]